MTQSDFFSGLADAISGDRFAPYASRNAADSFGAYAWNIALCESLYPALNCFEIALRNSIHAAAVRGFGAEDWFPGRLHPNELEKVNQLSNDLRRQRPAVGFSASDLVSNLPLGFWLSLFRTRYEQILWPQLLEPVFPHCPRGLRTRQKLYARLSEIRILRNRVFHHEPIWNLSDLPGRHGQILETIGWISPAMLALARLLDRFPGVYNGGAQPYQATLDAIARNWNPC